MEEVETAYHEAGHAVVLYRVGFDVESASIAHDEESLGRVAKPFPEVLVERLDMLEYSGEDGREFARRQIVGAFAGVKAVEILTGRDYDPHSLDTLPTVPGSDWSQLNVWMPFIGATAQYQAIYDEAWNEADRILRESWDAVTAVAEALLDLRELDATALRTIFEETGCRRVDARIRHLLLSLERDWLYDRGRELLDEGDPRHELEGLEQRIRRIDEELAALESDQWGDA